MEEMRGRVIKRMMRGNEKSGCVREMRKGRRREMRRGKGVTETDIQTVAEDKVDRKECGSVKRGRKKRVKGEGRK